MIVDCFCFFNEFDLLKIRLRELSPKVDRFVIVEADKTHSGQPKPYFFTDWHKKNLSPELLTRVILIQCSLPEFRGDRWELENAQRNAILHGLQGLSATDMILIGDVDEIPNLSTWNRQEGVFRMDAFFYKVNLRHRESWNGTVAVGAWRFGSPYGRSTPQDCRNFRDLLVPCGEGKHFSWLGDPQVKVKSFAHAELDTPDFQPDYTIHPGDKSTLMKVPMDQGWWPEGIAREEWVA